MQYEIHSPRLVSIDEQVSTDAQGIALDDPLVQALALVHVTGWRQAYGDLLPESFYDDGARADRARMWRSTLMHHQAPERVRIAAWPGGRAGRPGIEAGDDVVGEVVGFSIHGPARDTDRTGVELFALYVLQEHHGTGLGQRLLDAAIGASPACLWVAARNPRAIRFYEKNGFNPDGTRRTDAEAEDLEEIRMVRDRHGG